MNSIYTKYTLDIPPPNELKPNINSYTERQIKDEEIDN